jgi:hypothetical protein
LERDVLITDMPRSKDRLADMEKKPRKGNKKRALSSWTHKKAQLIVEGEVHVAPGTYLPYFPIRSSGGPTSSRPHIILCFGPNDTRVKVAIGPKSSRFELKKRPKDQQEFCVLDKGRPFLSQVRMVPAVMHAPEQAFINIEPTCDRGCLFCSADKERDLGWSALKWTKVIVGTYQKKPFEAVAITAGMPHGKRSMADLMIDVVTGVRDALPKIPIGVEPNAVPREALEMLKAAGADELKVNVQTATARTFKKVCPRLDRADILRCLRDGVEVFGAGNVASNVIIGLGETDKEVIHCVKDLAKMGVVANIRAIRVNNTNIKKLEKALGKKVGVKDPERLIFLMKEQAKILDKYSLDPRIFRTMCHRCACCDLTLGQDK